MADPVSVAASIVRLNPEVYKVLEKKALAQLPVAPNDPITAGIKIGVENTLRLIREELVIGA